jgi:excisionase family DNA binding protein
VDQTFYLPYISVPSMAEYLGISPQAVIMLVKKGDLPAFTLVGNRKMFERGEIEQWVRSNRA